MKPRDRNTIAKTLPGMGYPVEGKNHELYRRSALARWERAESRLAWFLERLAASPNRDDLPHWYGELWGKPRRPGQVEFAMAALADLGTPVSRVALRDFATDERELKLFQDVCLAHHARVSQVS